MTKDEFRGAVEEANELLAPLGEFLATRCSRPFTALVLVRLADRVLTDRVAIDSQLDPAQINDIFATMTVEKDGMS